MDIDCPDTVPSAPRGGFDPTQPSTSNGPPIPLQPNTMVQNSNGVMYYNAATPKEVAGPMRISQPAFPPSRTPSQASIHGPIHHQQQPPISSPYRHQMMSGGGGQLSGGSGGGPSNERVQQLRESAVGKQNYMQQWMGNGYNLPSSPGQMQQRPPSMIGSTMSTMSHFSHLSIGAMSTLSVNTEIANYIWPPNNAPNILSKVSGSSAENQDPRGHKQRMTPNDIMRSLRSTDERSQFIAVQTLIPYAEHHQFEIVFQRSELKIILYALFNLLTPREPQIEENERMIEMTLYVLYHIAAHAKYNKTCMKIIEVMNLEMMSRRAEDTTVDLINGYAAKVAIHHNIGIFYIVMYRASKFGARYVTKAWMLLSNLVCNTFLKKRFFHERTARPEDGMIRFEVIRFAVESLSKEFAPKPKGFAVSVIRNLSQANREVMNMAMQLNIIETFLNLMRTAEIHEDLLWSTTQGLSAFFALSANGEHFIRMGGAQVLCGLLSHGSSRLLHELLGCMSRIADLPAIKDQNMTEPIHSVVQLLGSFDPTIVEKSTAILMNIGVHNRNNKGILVQCGVTNHVFAVLRMSDEYHNLAQNPQHREMIRHQVGNIYENCLRLLNNVTLMSQQDNRDVAIEACKQISMNVESASALLNFIGLGKPYCRKLSITVLKRVIETVPSYAERFVDMMSVNQDKLHSLLYKRIFESLNEYRNSLSEQRKLGPSEETMAKLRDHEDIVKRAAGLLTTLCCNSNPIFLKDVTAMMGSQNANPFGWLSHEISDPMLAEWLTFILKVCQMEESQRKLILYQLMSGIPNVAMFMEDLMEKRPDPTIRAVGRTIMTLAQQQQLQYQQQIHQQQ